jgi:frataxin-like iron-binding protein CyaY
MDRKEFEVTVRETLENLERAVERLALDGVETYPAGTGIRLQFDDGGFVQLAREDAAQELALQRGGEVLAFYYDAVEEQWYGRADERPLTDVLDAELAARLAREVRLAEAM